MKSDLKKKLEELLDKVDKKVLETKLNQAMELLKNGKQDEVIKKLSNFDKNELQEKLQELDKLKPEDVENIGKKIKNNVSQKDLLSLKENLDDEGKKMLEKIISTFKIN